MGIDFHQWRTPLDFAAGESSGVRPDERGLVIAHPAGTTDHTDPMPGTTRAYEHATWTSPEHRIGFGATQLVASWNATTPAGTWLQVEMRGSTDTGGPTKWYVLGRWAFGDADIHRTSVPGQADADGTVDVDVFESTAGRTLHAYRLRVTLYRAVGTQVTPALRMVGAMASAVPDRFTVPAGRPAGGDAIALPVPTYSQRVHTGRYPRYGGGGEAWCSPTSTQMVVEHWGRYPSAGQLAWVDPGHADPSVAVAARGTYDHAYRGTGNWSFNVAYAAGYDLVAHVTRLHSLVELESYIRRGIPVITSQSFRAGELAGANYGTAGHLMVVVGFTGSGDVIVHDPAAATDADVRVVYRRHQFETVWLRTKRHLADGSVGSGSGGIVYLITPPPAG